MSLILPGYIQRDPDYYVTDFSEYTTGAQPPDFTQRWSSTNYTALVQSIAGSISGKALQWTRTGTSSWSMLSWDRVPAAADFEVLARFRANEAFANNEYFLQFGGRASGAAGSENLYAGSTAGATTGTRWTSSLFKRVAGASAFVGSVASPATANYTFNTWAWQRFRCVGSTLSVKNWIQGTAEPGSWDITGTDSALTAAGWIGIFGTANQSNPNLELDFFSVALKGKTAPSIKR